MPATPTAFVPNQGDVTTQGLVTVVGSNAQVICSGYWTDSDVSSITLTDVTTMHEQKSGLGAVHGVAFTNRVDDVTISFYPLPTATSPTEANYQALNLPPPGSVVHVTSRGGATSAAGTVVTRVAGYFMYIGNGSISQTSEGLMVFNLPCRRYSGLPYE